MKTSLDNDNNSFITLMMLIKLMLMITITMKKVRMMMMMLDRGLRNGCYKLSIVSIGYITHNRLRYIFFSY